jgi:CRISPR-associated protein (TIGR02584 family)
LDPSQFERRILLAVTGLSPQVLTETIYALTVGQTEPSKQFIPTEVHLVTTKKGAEHARLNLLSESPGQFHRLCSDYAEHGLKDIQFETKNIHQITHEDGSTLEDIRDSDDNDIAADYITQLVRQLTADDKAALHVSIAGGRKTMGYYLGYALSLYGREQDRLSHVLVSEPFEHNHEFYYPTPYESVVHVSHRGSDIAYDCRNANVELAEIPFVRLRQGLPEKLLCGDARFTEVVSEAQKSLPSVSLVIQPEEKSIEIAEKLIHCPPALLAFYWLLALKVKLNEGGIHWTHDGLAELYLDLYSRLVNRNSGNYEQAEKTLTAGMGRDFIEQKKSKINRLLTKSLGERLASEYLIYQLDPIAGSTGHLIGLQIGSHNIRMPSI